MYLTIYDLAGYAWKRHSRFWTERDIKQLVKRKELKPHYLGGRMVFKNQEVEDYFERRRCDK